MCLRKAFTLIELLVVLAIIAILMGLLLPAIQSIREAGRRVQCHNNLRELALALNNYEAANREFPSGTARSGAVWSAYILPFIEQSNLSDHLTLLDPVEESDPGDVDGIRQWIIPGIPALTDVNPVARNCAATAQRTELFVCPSSTSNGMTSAFNVGTSGLTKTFRTNYVACGSHVLLQDDDPRIVSDPNAVLTGAFVYGRQRRTKEFIDGMSNTILIGEVEVLEPPKIEPDGACQRLEFDNACFTCGICPGIQGYEHCIGARKDHAFLGSDDLDRRLDLSEGFCSTALLPKKYRTAPRPCKEKCAQAGFSCPPNPEYEEYELQFGGPHNGITVFAFADGSVRSVEDQVDLNLFRALGSIAGLESDHHLQ